MARARGRAKIRAEEVSMKAEEQEVALREIAEGAQNTETESEVRDWLPFEW